MHQGLHHLRVGTVDQLQQAAQAPVKPAADAPPAAPVPQPIDPPQAKAAPPANAGPGAVLDVRV
jgi:hypothetical protein